jgi:predicted aspartyl protease
MLAAGVAGAAVEMTKRPAMKKPAWSPKHCSRSSSDAGCRYVADAPRQHWPHLGAGYINGKGPFRLVLDTGASSAAVTAAVAAALGLPLDQHPRCGCAA